jgi:hypothetical protein
MTDVGQLNRVVWMLWLQGFEQAPEIVRFCLHSWKTRNPGWKVVTLDNESLSEYIDSDSLSVLRGLDINHTKRANLIRLYLISRHGGVWADATGFCVRPLDDWLPEYMGSGFFAFRNPGPDRILSNWFLASVKDNLLASTFYELHTDFFRKNSFPLQHTNKGKKRLKKLKPILSRNSRIAQLWTSPLVIRILKVYPYFIFHYHFARTVRENKACGEIWNRTPHLSADGPHKMKHAGLLSPMTSQLMDDLNQRKQPLYKLTWKYDREDVTDGCILDHIMRSIEWNQALTSIGAHS